MNNWKPIPFYFYQKVIVELKEKDLKWAGVTQHPELWSNWQYQWALLQVQRLKTLINGNCFTNSLYLDFLISKIGIDFVNCEAFKHMY